MARTIRVDYLARVEGEGSLRIRFKGDQPKDVQLRIFEPPRFFEAFLLGRDQTEAPDITARICGICPVAYQMSACHAMEDALGLAVSDAIRRLRRLLYCGEWIESHALHMFMLHAPDFLGFPDGIAMAKIHPEPVRHGLRIKKAGNSILRAIAGREIHPVNVRVGGFYKAPASDSLNALLPELRWARDAMRSSVEWMARFDFPDFERDYEFVALRHESEYPMCGGRLVSNKGLDIDVREYEDHFAEEHVERSTALHSKLVARGDYQCGPLARVNLDFEQLSPGALETARAIGFAPPCRNPFKSLLARGLETICALEEAVRLIETYTPPAPPFIDAPELAARGRACTEAPRGTLFHRYDVRAGAIAGAKIVPPTSQNQGSIEQDLFAIAPRLARMDHKDATLLAEQTVRNYDPCISCSAHFLTLELERQ